MGRHEEAVEAASEGHGDRRARRARAYRGRVRDGQPARVAALARALGARPMPCSRPSCRPGWPGCSRPAMYEVRARMRVAAGPLRGGGRRPRARAPADRRPSGQHPVLAADGVRAGGGRPRGRRLADGPAGDRRGSGERPRGLELPLRLAADLARHAGRSRERRAPTRTASPRSAALAAAFPVPTDELAAYRALAAAERARIDGSDLWEPAVDGRPRRQRAVSAAPTRCCASPRRGSAPATARRPRAR